MALLRLIGKLTGIEKEVEWSRGKRLKVVGPEFLGDYYVYIDKEFTVAILLPKSDHTLHVLTGDIFHATKWAKYDSLGRQVAVDHPPEKAFQWKIKRHEILYRGTGFSSAQPVYVGKVLSYDEFFPRIDEWLEGKILEEIRVMSEVDTERESQRSGPSIKEISLPPYGQLYTDAVVKAVYVKQGDVVRKDSPLADLDAGPVTLEVPSMYDGIVETVFVQVGGRVPVGEILFSILTYDKAVHQDDQNNIDCINSIGHELRLFLGRDPLLSLLAYTFIDDLLQDDRRVFSRWAGLPQNSWTNTHRDYCALSFLHWLRDARALRRRLPASVKKYSKGTDFRGLPNLKCSLDHEVTRIFDRMFSM